MNSVQPGPRLTSKEIERAKAIWSEYQESYDFSPYLGQMAVIDPKTARVWIGKTWREVAKLQDQEESQNPTYAVTVGKDYFVRKGGNR